MKKEEISKAVGNIKDSYILEAELYGNSNRKLDLQMESASELKSGQEKGHKTYVYFSLGLVASLLIVFSVILGSGKLTKTQGGTKPVEDQVAQSDTRTEASESKEEVTQTTSDSETVSGDEMCLQGTIIDGAIEDTPWIIVELDPAYSEISYGQVMFYLEEEKKELCESVGSVVKITCGDEFIEMEPPLGELISIEVMKENIE